MLARDVMSNGVLSIADDATVLEAIELLVTTRVSTMPVLDKDGFVVGIVSEADVVKQTKVITDRDTGHGEIDPALTADALARAKALRVADIMTRDVITAREDASLRDIVNLMARHNIKRIPIVRDRAIVGVVSQTDVLKGILSLASAGESGQTPAEFADDLVRRNVMAALHDQHGSSAYQCDVVISGGTVHLWGVAPSDDVRADYVETVRKVPGVAAVENHMHIPHRTVRVD